MYDEEEKELNPDGFDGDEDGDLLGDIPEGFEEEDSEDKYH